MLLRSISASNAETHPHHLPGSLILLHAEAALLVRYKWQGLACQCPHFKCTAAAAHINLHSEEASSLCCCQEFSEISITVFHENTVNLFNKNRIPRLIIEEGDIFKEYFRTIIASTEKSVDIDVSVGLVRLIDIV